MARPTKQGVDYFPLDVHLDDKFKFVEIKYKLEGFAIVVKLLQKIYACGYWYKWTDDEVLLFSDEIRAEHNLVESVVNECLDRDIFSKELHNKYNILTSKGIQKRYKEIVRRRKDVEVIEEYLLIDDLMTTLTQHNDDIKPTEGKQHDDKSTQSKVKESKVNKSNNNYSPQFNEWWELYPRKIEKKKSFSAFKTAIKKHSFEVLLSGLNGYIEHIKKNQTEEQFIKHASTFLNGESFKDYLPKETKPKKISEEKQRMLDTLSRIDELTLLMNDIEDEEEFRQIEEERNKLKSEVSKAG